MLTVGATVPGRPRYTTAFVLKRRAIGDDRPYGGVLMQGYRIKPRAALAAVAAAAGILLAAGLLAGALKKSELYSQSRFLSTLLSEDAVELRDFATDRENLSTLVKFVGAVTEAYIDFELIPVGEADAFAAVFESRPRAVRIVRFEYRGKDLSIFGTAPDEAQYGEFVARLTDTGSFASVSGSFTDSADGAVSFEIGTVAHA
jgi:hypothetical protein